MNNYLSDEVLFFERCYQVDSKRWSLIIGINRYGPDIAQLHYSVSDAKNVEQVLNSRRDGFASTESILMVDNGDSNITMPIKNNILKHVIRICSEAKSTDTILIYFTGHGEIGERKDCYLLPSDAIRTSIEQSGIPWQWFREQLDKSHAKNKIMIIDACRSGAGKGLTITGSKDIISDMELNISEGFVCLSSCSGAQDSYEDPSYLKGSIFSHYLAKGISGAANDPLQPGVISIDGLYNYVRERTKDYAQEHLGVSQVPYLISKANAKLTSFIICASSLDCPINRVLVLTEDPFLGKLAENGIKMSGIARDAIYDRDLKRATKDAQKKFEYEAVYIDVGNDWDSKREFIRAIRGRYPVVPFVLMGSRSAFMDRLNESEGKIYRDYFFLDVNTPLVRVRANIEDTLRQVEWDIRTRYGERTEK